MTDLVLAGIRIVIFFLGVALVIFTLFSAIQTFVLPRGVQDFLTRLVFRNSSKVFRVFSNRVNTYEERDAIWALFAPVTLLFMPAVWLALVLTGYMGMFWALSAHSVDTSFTRAAVQTAFNVSGSSLLTLGFATQDGLISTALSFSEATIGLVLVALLIAYLPTMYGAFARREAAVTLLEVRAGSPPSAIEMFSRYHRLHRMDKLTQVWEQWEMWFADLEESHSSLAPLSFFRSPRAHRSWITSAGAILDAAALARSTLDIPTDVQADLTIRAGFIALRHIADFFDLSYKPNPEPTDPISISRLEFDLACQELIDVGVPIKADRDQAWRDFSGWRVNYDTVLLKLCALTMAPYAPWSSDRSIRSMREKHLLRIPFVATLLGRPQPALAEGVPQRLNRDS